MKRRAILTLSCLVAGLSAGTSFAQSRNESIDSITVTATRVPVALHSTARIVTLLDSMTIASAPAETVNDLLKYALGVDVRQRGAMGMQTDISIRGGTYNQVAVLLDGINITDPQTGHNSFDFPVNLCDIERIEVLEGPAARVYGTSSLLGAVNIVTRKTPENAVTASVEGGSFRSLGATASAEIKHRGGFNGISAGYQRSDGYSRNAAGGLNSDFSAVKAFWHGAHDFGRRDLRWQAGVSNKDFGSSTFYSAKFDDQFEHTLKSSRKGKAPCTSPRPCTGTMAKTVSSCSAAPRTSIRSTSTRPTSSART